MGKVRIGIIGLGNIAKKHLENYTKIPDAEIVAACDLRIDQLDDVVQKYKIARTYSDFNEMLKRDDLDAVDVCLHNNLHAPVAIAVMKSGKHCYCEKPIAGCYTDGKSMLKAAEQYGKMLHIQLGKLYEDNTRIAKMAIDQGLLGKIYFVRSTGYRRRGRPFVDGYGSKEFGNKTACGGGALFDMGVYNISRILYLLGPKKINRIVGRTYQELAMNEKRKIESGFNVEEIAMGLVNFEDGTSFDIIESWAVHLNEFEGSFLLGSEGGLRLDPLSYHSVNKDLVVDTTFVEDRIMFMQRKLNDTAYAYDSSQNHWIAAIQGKVPLLPTAQIALDTMLISEGIYLSEQLGREVTADEVIEISKSTAIKI